MLWIGLVVGLFVGCFIGILIMSTLQIYRAVTPPED